MGPVQGSLRSSVLLLCVCVSPLLLVHFALGNGYGFHQDELQFLSDARHLAWGYVAYPPLTSFCGRLAVALFGISPGVFRLPAALINAVSVLLTGLVARELGGGRAAQLLAAAAMFPLGLAFGSVLQYNTTDLLSWMIVLLFTARVLRTADGRNWLGAGFGIGLGVESKYSIGILALSLLAGLLLVPSMRQWLRSRWFWCGAAVALAVAAPNLLWLGTHGFVTLRMEHFIHARDVRLGRADGYFTDQLRYTMLALPLVLASLVFLLRSTRFRFLSIFFLGPLLLFALLRGRGYYLLPAYPALYAAGAVSAEQWLHSRRPTLRIGLRGLFYAALLSDTVFIAVMFLPMFPPESAGWNFQMQSNPDMPYEVGWPEFVQQVAAVRDGLSPAERQRLGVLANNYGEAGALELYGPQYGLPEVISSANSFFARGYGASEPETVIVTGSNLQDQLHNFTECRVAAHVVVPHNVRNDEVRYYPEILVCSQLRGRWPDTWAKSQKFG